MFEIKTNVPIPKAKRPNGSRKRKYPFTEMTIGAFFFVPRGTPSTVQTQASKAGRELKYKFKTQKIYMRESLEGWRLCEATELGAVPGIGVWRIA